MRGLKTPQINAYLQQAVYAYHDTQVAENLLWQAQRLNPLQLEVYVALYKFYFYKYRLMDAERVARQTLNVCAQQGQFEPQWEKLDLKSANWYNPQDAERIYLYTLKALGFIRLRRLDFCEGLKILEKLRELDPKDQVGGSVLLEVAEGMREVIFHQKGCDCDRRV